VRARGLGRRTDARQPDVLSVSLSTTDAIGHDFGPDSREIHDHLVRLDRWLGAFLDSLSAIVPTGRTIFALTADHGVSPMPERLAHDGIRGARVDVATIAHATAEQLRARWSTDFGIEFDNGILTADVDALVAHGVDVDSLARALSAAASKKKGVRRIYTPKTLAAAPSSDADAARWKRSLPTGLGWLIAGVAEDGYVFSDGAKAEHGSMHPESRSVPILFVVPGVTARTDSRVARTVDIAPTIAALLGIRATEAVDGRSLDITARR
jgi:arylsulfatase A-like enzyme